MEMEELISKRLADIKDQDVTKYQKLNALWIEIKKIIEKSNDHLDQITAQLPDYDKHNKLHSEKVLSNIQSIVGEVTLNKLSIYELILVFSSAYLHDAAMALPSWENIVLKSIEGTDSIYNVQNQVKICNDLKPVQKLSELSNIISRESKKIYGDFADVKNFVFALVVEDAFCIDLAERTQEYESFRSRYSVDLQNLVENNHEYLDYSDFLRTEFVRATHHTRIEKYIKALRDRIEIQTGGIVADRFTEDLASICRAHGDTISFINGLSLKSSIVIGENANIQFIAILLRLGDIVHFSSDRAPVSLFAEKGITNATSLSHWRAKFQELNYEISDVDAKTMISYSAFCKDPDSYYFIQEYLDWIDIEIDNYYEHLHKLEYNNFSDTDKYRLSLNQCVNRAQVTSDATVFIPDRKIKFTLDQSKILTLLMGVQLYKDKYLCLRELYQNSLDACKCMQAQNLLEGRQEDFKIEFGSGNDTYQGKSCKYIYCIDNGTGMTKDIVKNYLLKIGNSYYKSRDFNQLNTNWMNSIKPTSQFGIGILSCFMIADRIQILTKHYNDVEFEFSLEGSNEHFYYQNPNKLDLEKLGRHGTIVKLFLKDEVLHDFNNTVPEDLSFIIHARDTDFGDDPIKEDIQNKFKHSLFYLINYQIGIPNKDITVMVRTDDGNIHSIIAWNEIFDYHQKDVSKLKNIKELWCEYHFADGSKNPYEDVVKYKDLIEDITLVVKNDLVELYSHISLPLLGFPENNTKLFNFEQYVWKSENKILLDGVSVSDQRSSISDNAIQSDIRYISLINFIGAERPVLSVDRNSIISVPDSVTVKCKELIPLLAKEIVNKIREHIAKCKIEHNSKEMSLIIEIIIRKFGSISGEIIKNISECELMDIEIKDAMIAEGRNLGPIMSSPKISLSNPDFHDYSELTQELLIGRLIKSTHVKYDNFDLSFHTDGYVPVAKTYNEMHFRKNERLHAFAICADVWEGDYAAYDIVSSVWPVVPQRLFEKLPIRDPSRLFDDNRVKKLEGVGNGISGIANLNPILINPKFGISSEKGSDRSYKVNYIGTCQNMENMFWLFELNGFSKLVIDEKRDYVLFAFIAPRKLNEAEKTRLDDFIENDPIYVKGVTEGWSILFLGNARQYYMLPGRVNKSALVSMVPESIKNKKIDDITYYNLDETLAF